MSKPVVSPGAWRAMVGLAGAVLAAVSAVLEGVSFEELVSGGTDAWKRLGFAALIAAGGAMFGWTKRWLNDIAIEDLPYEVQEAMSVPPKAPTSAPTQQP